MMFSFKLFLIISCTLHVLSNARIPPPSLLLGRLKQDMSGVVSPIEAAWTSLTTEIVKLNNDIIKEFQNNAFGVINNFCRKARNTEALSEDDAFLSHLDADNREALRILNSLITQKKSVEFNWQLVGHRDGVIVEKCFPATGSFVSASDAAKGTKHACVRSSGIINASAEKVFELFLDNSRVREYNEHCQELSDVRYFPRLISSRWVKLAYAISPRYGPFKARDFCTVVYYEKKADGSYCIMNRPAYISSHGPRKNYVRATVLLGGNIIRPLGVNKSAITMIAHVNPGGGADNPTAAWIINQLCAVGPPAFIRKLEAAAQKK